MQLLHMCEAIFVLNHVLCSWLLQFSTSGYVNAFGVYQGTFPSKIIIPFALINQSFRLLHSRVSYKLHCIRYQVGQIDWITTKLIAIFSWQLDR